MDEAPPLDLLVPQLRFSRRSKAKVETRNVELQ
jgi:hypothetical protein